MAPRATPARKTPVRRTPAPRPIRAVIPAPCPSNIWLLGGITNCNKPINHDGLHEVTLSWGVK